jgi:FlaA1/EpsC-like NDP-sugar epimerase
MSFPSLQKLRNRHFFLIDLVLLPLVAVLAFALRLDATGMGRYGSAILLFIVLAVPIQLLVAYWLGLYRRFWRYASLDELLLIAVVTGLSTVVTAALLFGVAVPLTGISVPRSIPLINCVLAFLVMGGVRFAVRFEGQHRQRTQRRERRQSEKRVLIMGAGDAGSMVVQEMQANPHLGLVPVGYVDDDERKWGGQIRGVPVLGGRDRIPEFVGEHNAEEVVIAMPTAPGSTIRQIVAICDLANVPARTIPGMYDILSGQVSVSQIRNVEIEDLLRRNPVQIDAAAVEELLRGRRVLVTGAGGSIGSELCRQIARAQPECLVVLGHGENSIFHIVSELQESAKCELVSMVADIRDQGRLDRIVDQLRPELIFHAAAHKHVPLMEANVCEAVSNNVLGTRNLIRTAERSGVSHFILISTDKAVNPTSVMGATKRVAELLVYQAAQRDGVRFSAVRFGNVLGSRGSVVNTFKQQIAEGRTVTVTHPEMRRFFMTIPEAVQLVLQAAALGRGGEVFVLDMGEPVRIVDLATDLIRLSGLRPKVRAWDARGADEDQSGSRDRLDESSEDEIDWDIEVAFTGARQGEKLFEELFSDGEECHRTRHEKILVAENGQEVEAHSDLDEQVGRLAELAQKGDEEGVRRLLGEIVPDYRPAQETGAAEQNNRGLTIAGGQGAETANDSASA